MAEMSRTGISMTEIPIVLLAAGRSERMGQVKQLLPWGSVTLIEHQIQVLRETGHPVCVVLGYRAEHLVPIIQPAGVDFVVNEKWEKGMGGSIAAGVKHVLNTQSQARGMLIALVDQPLIPGEHYLRMIRAFRPGEALILATRSRNAEKGVPALFDEAYFPELVELKGDKGAKGIIQAHREHMLSLECHEADEDLDTPVDYQRLLALFNQGRG